MDESKYAGNSNRSKQQPEKKEKKIQEAVVAGSTEVKKKGIVEKTVTKWLPGLSQVDSVGDMAGPIVLKGMYDILKNVLDMIFYPDGSPSTSSNGKKLYHQMSRKSTPSKFNGGRRVRQKSVYDFDGIIYEDRGDAELAYHRLAEILDDQKFCSVADLYNVSNLVPESIDWDYGWTDISDAEIIRLRDGSGRCRIELPDPMPLD